MARGVDHPDTRPASVSVREFATILAGWALTGWLLWELSRRIHRNRLQARATGPPALRAVMDRRRHLFPAPDRAVGRGICDDRTARVQGLRPYAGQHGRRDGGVCDRGRRDYVRHVPGDLRAVPLRAPL